MDETFDATDMVAGFIADLPAGVQEWPGHQQGGGLFFFGAILTPPPGGLAGLDPDEVVSFFSEIQVDDIMRHHTDGRPWPACPVHDSGGDERHALDPHVDGWRCPYGGGTWSYGYFGNGD